MSTPLIAAISAFTFSVIPILAQVAAPPADWSGMIEKGGTIAVLVWMVLYFQRRTDASTMRSEAFAERALDALGKNTEATKEIAASLRDLRETIHDSHPPK